MGRETDNVRKSLFPRDMLPTAEAGSSRTGAILNNHTSCALKCFFFLFLKDCLALQPQLCCAFLTCVKCVLKKD